MDVNAFVWSNLYAFLWDAVHAIGGTDDDVQRVWDFLTPILSGPFGVVLVPLLFPPLALWRLLQNLIGALSTELSGGLAWLQSKIDDIYNWVLGQINDAISTINQTITGVSNWFSAQLTAAYNWVTTQLNDVSNWFNAQLTDLDNWVTAQVTSVSNWVSAQFTGFTNWLSAQVTNISNWVSAQLTDVDNWLKSQIADFTNWFNGELASLSASLIPLFRFLQWWQSGPGDFLTHFCADPVGAILDLIAPTFLRWLSQLLADNW